MGVFTGSSALLVIDMVKDFVDPDGALSVPGARTVVPRISDLIREARDDGIPVIYVNDAHDPDDEEFEKWPPHSVAGTEGAKVVEDLEPGNSDHVLEKKRFSAFYGTRLDELLEELGVDHLVMTGTVTNICIFASTLDALMRGYRVTVPGDAVAGIDEGDHDFALRQIEEVFGAEVL